MQPEILCHQQNLYFPTLLALQKKTFDFSPVHPNEYDWSVLYPQNKELKKVQFLDVGCGYGGLLGKYFVSKKSFFGLYIYNIYIIFNSTQIILVTLSKMFPDNLMLGLEIRVKVSDYVNDRIKALRIQYPGEYQNAAVLRTNAMKYLPNFFYKGQVTQTFCN